MRQLIVDYLQFEIQPSQINESMKENDGKLIRDNYNNRTKGKKPLNVRKNNRV